MDNPELVEWAVVSALGDEVEVVAAALGEQVDEGMGPLKNLIIKNVDLIICTKMVLYLLWLLAGGKWNVWFIVVISLIRWKVLVATS